MENHETRLPRPILGHGDNFLKVMTKTDLPYNTSGDLRPAGDLSHFEQASDIYL